VTKTWRLITGASSGIGSAMTQQLLDRGDRVAATTRRDGALAGLQEKYGESLSVVRLDLTDTGSIRAAVNEAFRRMGRIDVVVSNAACGLVGAAEELTDAQIDKQIATRAALPHLRKQGGGRIVQISSEGGQVVYPAFSLYHATKWGIEGFVETVAKEVDPFGIDCMIAEPGPTATNFGAGIVMAPPLSAYDGTPAGVVRRAVNERSFDIRGDTGRTASAIIAATDSEKPPFRLPLGSIAYGNLTRELARRLAEIDAQRDVAFSADRDAAAPAVASSRASRAELPSDRRSIADGADTRQNMT
jgi:NAD(P)-dependent dehydrogenase (short-subunit alcohol dehydrogenase family)